MRSSREEEADALRRRVEALEALATYRDQPSRSGRSFTGRVVNGGNKPSTMPGVFLVEPGELSFNESAGSTTTFTDPPNGARRRVAVLILGGTVPPDGARVVATLVEGGRWVARYAPGAGSWIHVQTPCLIRLPNAFVTVYRAGVAVASGYTDSSGRFDLAPPAPSSGVATVRVVVTYPNRRTYDANHTAFGAGGLIATATMPGATGWYDPVPVHDPLPPSVTFNVTYNIRIPARDGNTGTSSTMFDGLDSQCGDQDYSMTGTLAFRAARVPPVGSSTPQSFAAPGYPVSHFNSARWAGCLTGSALPVRDEPPEPFGIINSAPKLPMSIAANACGIRNSYDPAWAFWQSIFCCTLHDPDYGVTHLCNRPGDSYWCSDVCYFNPVAPGYSGATPLTWADIGVTWDCPELVGTRDYIWLDRQTFGWPYGRPLFDASTVGPLQTLTMAPYSGQIISGDGLMSFLITQV